MLLARGQELLDKTAEEIRTESGVKVLATAADITKADQVDASAATVKDTFGTVHIVVNNAGGPMRRMDRQILWPDSDWIADLDNKILGALRVTRAFLPLMPERRDRPHHQHQWDGLDDRLGTGVDARPQQRRDEPGDRLSGRGSRQPADHR